MDKSTTTAVNASAIDKLLALEEIRQAKHRYLRCVDLKLWDEIGDVFTAGATASYGTPAMGGKKIGLAGRDAIVDFLRTNMGPTIISVHHASQPEITIDDETSTAEGTWCFEDMIIATEHNVVIKGAAFYEDRYEKGEDGKWRIAHTGYQRTYEAMLSTADLPSFQITANRWAKPAD
jgi:SnoaL-like protein